MSENIDASEFVVLPNDHGIRPAVWTDRCAYCQRTIGSPHTEECVVIVVDVTYQVKLYGHTVALFTQAKPSGWDRHMMSFHVNESSWCKDNMLNSGKLEVLAPDIWAKLLEKLGDNCLCGAIDLEVAMVSGRARRAGPEE